MSFQVGQFVYFTRYNPETERVSVYLRKIRQIGSYGDRYFLSHIKSDRRAIHWAFSHELTLKED